MTFTYVCMYPRFPDGTGRFPGAVRIDLLVFYGEGFVVGTYMYVGWGKKNPHLHRDTCTTVHKPKRSATDQLVYWLPAGLVHVSMRWSNAGLIGLIGLIGLSGLVGLDGCTAAGQWSEFHAICETKTATAPLFVIWPFFSASSSSLHAVFSLFSPTPNGVSTWMVTGQKMKYIDRKNKYV